MHFDAFFEQATQDSDLRTRPPYDWQRRVAVNGLPEAIDVETGAGKTAGVVLGWLYRLLYHPDPTVREAIPPWLVYALPMRSLVEQTEAAVKAWLKHLGLDDDVRCHRLMGGSGAVTADWRERPGLPTVVVGTIDMLVSRALMRGYGANRWVWPVDFGLLHAGCHWVMDEVQLLGPALATTRQLDAFRQSFGTAAPCSSTWMSATLDRERLRTVDNPEVADPLVLLPADIESHLGKRLTAMRYVSELQASDAKELARRVVDEHRPASLTLVVVNTVARAQELFASLGKLADQDAPHIALLHSRFRPVERAAILRGFLGVGSEDDLPVDRILVATQVVEAGLDISARTLVTDAAPWSSIVQRAGRCNRAGEHDDARLLWVAPPRSAPYDERDIEATATALRAIEGEGVTNVRLRQLGREVVESEPIVAVLRRRDLVDLFDTTPDLLGNDVDIASFIRADRDIYVQVAWRESSSQEDGPPFMGGPPQPEELCRVPIGDLRAWAKKRMPTMWVVDHLHTRRRWMRASLADLRPGAVVVVNATAGGYDVRRGWDSNVTKPVPVLDERWGETDEGADVAPTDEGVADDPASFTGAWVGLATHLGDTASEARALMDEARMTSLLPEHVAAVVVSAAVHDIGKAHDVFQNTLVRSAGDGAEAASRLRPLAKSAPSRRTRHERPHFRHELVSALMLAEHADLPARLCEEASAADADLVRYLVAAHHGRVRVGIRAIPGETPPPGHEGRPVALGVVHGDMVAAFPLGDVQVGPTTIRLDSMHIGGEGSWTAMALALRDHPALGPFRLATLEALVRLADWRASASPSVALTLDEADQ